MVSGSSCRTKWEVTGTPARATAVRTIASLEIPSASMWEMTETVSARRIVSAAPRTSSEKPILMYE